MGEEFEEVLQREELVRQRDLLVRWASQGATLFRTEEGIFATTKWGKTLKLIDASRLFPRRDAE